MAALYSPIGLSTTLHFHLDSPTKHTGVNYHGVIDMTPTKHTGVNYGVIDVTVPPSTLVLIIMVSST